MAFSVSPTSYLVDGTALPRFPSVSVSRVAQVDVSTTHAVSRGVEKMNSAERRNILGIDRKIFGERVAAFLRGRYPSKTAACAAADLDCSIHQVEKWLDGASSPSGYIVVRLIYAYGPAIIRDVMGASSPKWLDAAYADAENDRIEQQISELRERQRELRPTI
jgi:hypothetical protein